MAAPFLAVVVPAFNEEPRIGATLESLSGHLQTKSYEWEIVVADDGSDDTTAQIVREASEKNPRIRLVSLDHGGKGSAMKGGMLASDAAWRFMCDADLAMPAEQIDRFLPEDGPPDYDIGVGSREVPGSRRIGEPGRRHIKGRIYNWITRMLGFRGLNDTQCGFKMYRGELADRIFDAQTLKGWGFDVEILLLGKKVGATITEVPIDWYYRTESKMGTVSGALGLADVFRVRFNEIRGKYRGLKS